MDSHILIIEDSANVRRLIGVTLRSLQATITSAADGVSGLETALRISPTVIVLDIGLPGMDGWEVLDRLRADDSTKEAKVLIVTARARSEWTRLADERGADHFMNKPFHPTDLRNRVSALLAS